MSPYYHRPVIGTGNPTIVSLILRPLDWRLKSARIAKPDNRAAAASVPVLGGDWAWSPDQLPYSTEKPHPYFTAPEGRSLAESLRNSSGRNALLHSFNMESGWLICTNSGLVVKSSDELADQEISSGSGSRMYFQFPVPTLRDAVVAVQRNSSNYYHFLTEVVPSLMAWEKHIHETDTIAVMEAPFARHVLRLAGFNQRISLLPQPAAIRAIDVKLLRLLPVGYFNPGLLRELSARVVRGAKANRCGQEVLFLTRAKRDRRNLTNESEAVEIVRRKFPNVDIVTPGDLPVEDQVRRCDNARIVIAPHGAQAANLLWSNRLEHYVEIGVQEDRFSIAMARLLGAQTHHCASRPTTPGDRWSDHACETGSLRRILDSL
jgi:hypothetical protein